MMRLLSIPPALLYTITLLLTTSSATPLQRELPAAEEEAAQLQNNTLVARCDYACGWSGQLCCDGPNLCYTDVNNQAQCAQATVTAAAATTTVAGGSGGYWETYTSTWVETDLVTKTAVYSSFVGVTAAATATATQQATCDWAANESPCGPICCASGQYCNPLGQCLDAGNGGYTTAGVGATYSAPLRPTTGTYTISTATVVPTTTVPFIAPVATGSNMTITEASSSGGGGLSGGAIAGIVIGVLIGLALLALLCFCCIVRGLWVAILGLFGLGDRRRRNTRVEETYISEHHEGGGGGGGGRVWYGDRPARPEREKKSGVGGWGAVAAGLGALGLGLAGKRALDKRKDRRSSKTEVSSDYYYSDYYTNSSPSSESSGDRRTRRSSRR